MDNRLIEVGRYGYIHEAQIAEALLEANGIVSKISVDDCGGMRPHFQISQGVRLLVGPTDHEVAEQLLLKLENTGETLEAMGEDEEEYIKWRRELEVDKKKTLKWIAPTLLLFIALVTYLVIAPTDNPNLRYGFILGLISLWFLAAFGIFIFEKCKTANNP